MLTALKRMPAGAREAAVNKMMAAAPPAPAAGAAAGGGADGGGADSYRFEVVCKLAKPDTAVGIRKIAAYDAERVAVEYDAGDGSSMVAVWRAAAGAWPDFGVSKTLEYAGEQCVDLAWNPCEFGSLQLAVAFADR
jgi:hypothetical protein